MFDLLLAVSCSLAVGVIFKIAGPRRLDRLGLVTVNYAAAMAVGGMLTFWEAPRALGAIMLPPSLLVLAGGTGVLFISTFFLYAWATQVAGLSLAVGVMRVSVVIPVLAAWVIWAEAPTLVQAMGLSLAAVAFFLIARTEDAAPDAATLPADPEAPARGRVFGVLALLFLSGGLVDVSIKTFDEVFAGQTASAVFLLMLYGVAFAVGLALVLVRRRRGGGWPDRATIGWGVVLGLVNYGSTAFFLRAVAQLPAPFVFPVNNIAVVLGAALLGVYVWRERLSRINRVGLGLAAVALVLLGL